ncbi:MAG: TIR domain-containing protein [Clostridia bacterium]|nr:TIR domain-containing protein [Clostridia bacterium]
MAIFKCKMCGGDLNVTEEIKIIECDYCGTSQTVAAADSEKKITLFNRANRLRMMNDFDKAAGIYESIIAEFPEEAEAYWGLCLCKYGIEYVDDPATAKKIPTCHRSSFESIMDDSDFEQVMEYADALTRKVYRDEAKQIEEIRKGIIAVSANEEPYDIFICYKETAENGDRTLDSVIAQDVYDELTGKGYRVFFSRITLEDKLGVEYEPYIFAALNSAKIMLVFGTDYEYFNAVWVKNEWSRYLKLMATDKTKHLIPCFKGVDAYDMPKEFAKLQAQDMGKVGATQDLMRGIEKILPKNNNSVAAPATVQTVAASANPSVDSYLKRVFIFLADGDFKSADEYCEKVLDIDPENGQAYLGKLMSELKVRKLEYLKELNNHFDKSNNYLKIRQYGDTSLVATLESYIECVNVNIEQTRINLRTKIQSAQKLQNLISANSHSVGVKTDGTVVTNGNYGDNRCNLDNWKDIIAVSASTHTVGLKADGTVIAAGNNITGQCNVSNWKNIIAVSAGGYHTVGLKVDGTVVATKFINGNYVPYSGECDVNNWKDIVAVSAGHAHTVGLKTDGTVVAVGYNKYDACSVNSWNDVVAVSAGYIHTVALKTDGTVVSVGFNKEGQCNVSGWRNIVAVAAGGNHTIGLKSDGTVVAVGSNDNGQCNVSDWADIVAVSAGSIHTVGIKADGTVIAVGSNNNDQCSVSDWRLFTNIDTVAQERKENMEKARMKVAEEIKAEQESKNATEEARAQKELIVQQRRSAGLCQHCGGEFKGLFTKKCVRCGKPKDY